MTYKVNGVAITIQPSEGGWLPREAIGTDGNGHPIYPATREYELTWSLTDVAGFNELQTWYDSVAVTGSAIVDLPHYANATWAFKSYTGCVLNEPQMDSFYEQHQPITMRITNIRT